jgi:prepilin-type N-terminal cleavage/methylation domain-containing protein
MKRSHGFTLVELLVVITIIGILAGVTLGMLSSGRETARAAKTRTTIAKIDNVILAKYEAYRFRKLPLRADDLKTLAAAGPNAARAIARIRMNTMRDLIRMEMPDRWNDVADTDGSSRQPLMATQLHALSGGDAPWVQTAAAARHYGRFRRALDSGVPRETIEKHGPAECLYSIVMSNPETASLFNDNEIGDVDGDGLQEFVDGWDRPIMFIRWPAGFLPTNGADTDAQTGQDIDSFDQRAILTHHYATMPLIVSAGPDGSFDINFGKRQDTSQAPGDVYLRYTIPPGGNLDPYIVAPSNDDGTVSAMVGQPMDADPADGNDNWHDNIHNHRLEKR